MSQDVIVAPTGDIAVFDDQPVRWVAQGERPWFLLADVCRAMGIKPNKGSFYRQADMLADYEKRFPSREEAQLLLEMGKNPAFRTAPQNLRGGSKHSNIGNFARARIIAESGVYVLYATGKDALTPGTPAYRFKRKVFEVVIPAVVRGLMVPVDASKASSENGDARRWERLSRADAYLSATEVVEYLNKIRPLGVKPWTMWALFNRLERLEWLEPWYHEGKSWRRPSLHLPVGFLQLKCYAENDDPRGARWGIQFSLRSLEEMVRIFERDGMIRSVASSPVPALPESITDPVTYARSVRFPEGQ